MRTVNLETTIRQDLWEAVKGTYQASNYRHAVSDAMQHLTDLLRIKTNSDEDGWDLVNYAFGTKNKNPALKINRLETESERMCQDGIAHILRGMYQSIRNPRKHEQWVDTKETADAIIHFISYLLDIIDKSEEPFTIPRFLDSVFDVYFVDSPKYAEGLVNEIPSNKRLDTLIEVFRARSDNTNNARLVSLSILSKLSDEELARFASVVSNKLRSAQDVTEIRTTLAVLPGDFWPRISDLARQRIERRLFVSMNEGQLDDFGNCSEGGILGTWAMRFIPHFDEESKSKAGNILYKKLYRSAPERHYTVKYFLSIFPDVITISFFIENCAEVIMKAISDGDQLIATSLERNIDSFPKAWSKALAEHANHAELPGGLMIVHDDDDNTPLLRSI
jgi:uncharacterized protein (TIGR02391 family)